MDGRGGVKGKKEVRGREGEDERKGGVEGKKGERVRGWKKGSGREK